MVRLGRTGEVEEAEDFARARVDASNEPRVPDVRETPPST
jgi:hypothetical protein